MPVLPSYRNLSIGFLFNNTFDEQKLVADVKCADFSFETDNPNENYSVWTNSFSLTMEKHAPLKK